MKGRERLKDYQKKSFVSGQITVGWCIAIVLLAALLILAYIEVMALSNSQNLPASGLSEGFVEAPPDPVAIATPLRAIATG